MTCIFLMDDDKNIYPAMLIILSYCLYYYKPFLFLWKEIIRVWIAKSHHQRWLFCSFSLSLSPPNLDRGSQFWSLLQRNKTSLQFLRPIIEKLCFKCQNFNQDRGEYSANFWGGEFGHKNYPLGLKKMVNFGQFSDFFITMNKIWRFAVWTS